MVSSSKTLKNAYASLCAKPHTLDAVLARALAVYQDQDEPAHAECCAVLNLLDDLDCDQETQASVLWFYIAVTDQQAWAQASVGDALKRLVDGQLAAEKVARLYQHKTRGGEGLRRLLLAIIHDLRVVFALLARQLVRMRMAGSLPTAAAARLAQLTADIHAPLANRLGIWQLKWELEDLAFRQLHPDSYKQIATMLDERRADRERFIDDCIQTLQQTLLAEGIRADIAGRPKHIYSIWHKMQRKHLSFDELYDIRATRVIVDTVTECYAALGIVHSLWPHLPREFDDYIARPKSNGYRSLHTVVIAPGERTLEVQIRTHEMHRMGELGVAAHWRYKEGGAGDEAFEKRIAWMRQLLDQRGHDDGGLFSDFATEIIEDRVYLLTPQGDVIDLPSGATVLDFAYRVHTQVGHCCRGAKVNGRIVPLTYRPRSGDRIQVITGKVAEPSRDWLLEQHGYLHTSRARNKVRAFFRKRERESNLSAGRDIFERELKRLALNDVEVERLPGEMGVKDQDALMEALALGDITPGQLARVAHRLQQPQQDAVAPELPQRAEAPADVPTAFKVEGVSNLLTSVARCCQPVPGDKVLGYITQGRGVSVHRADCASLMHLQQEQPDRVIDVEWGRSDNSSYQVEIGVSGYDRKDLHKEIVACISGSNTPIVASSSRVDTRQAQLYMRFTLRVTDLGQLSDIMHRLSVLPNVMDVHRISS